MSKIQDWIEQRDDVQAMIDDYNDIDISDYSPGEREHDKQQAISDGLDELNIKQMKNSTLEDEIVRRASETHSYLMTGLAELINNNRQKPF